MGQCGRLKKSKLALYYIFQAIICFCLMSSINALFNCVPLVVLAHRCQGSQKCQYTLLFVSRQAFHYQQNYCILQKWIIICLGHFCSRSPLHFFRFHQYVLGRDWQIIYALSKAVITEMSYLHQTVCFSYLNIGIVDLSGSKNK